jgi:hypothetical protein
MRAQPAPAKKPELPKKPEAPKPAPTPRPESTKVEAGFAGKRITLRDLTWQRKLTGTCIKVEKYLFVLRLDEGGTVAVMKHSVGLVTLAGEKQEDAVT